MAGESKGYRVIEMMEMNFNSFSRILRLAVPVGVLLGGCADPNGANWWQAPRLGGGADGAWAESNIVRVNKFFSQMPWLSFKNDGSRTPDGVACAVYLESGDRPKGVFGDGTIIVQMFRMDRDALGREASTMIHEWELPADKAYPWRAKEKTALGWGYGLRLNWPDDLDIEGRQVAFVIKYVRGDGRVISSTPQVLRVPMGAAVARGI